MVVRGEGMGLLFTDLIQDLVENADGSLGIPPRISAGAASSYHINRAAA